ncbi:unnamed protein product [Scytosiphon promiscuus]
MGLPCSWVRCERKTYDPPLVCRRGAIGTPSIDTFVTHCLSDLVLLMLVRAAGGFGTAAAAAAVCGGCFSPSLNRVGQNQNHTKKCSTCLRALKNVKRALTTAKTSAVLSFAWAILRGARAVAARTTAANARAGVAVSGTTTAASVAASGSVLNLVTARAMLPAVALMFASLWSAKMIRKFHDLFYIYSYTHQDNP